MITIHIRTDNAAFADENRAGEVARILSTLSHKILTGSCPAAIYDSNGNRCGFVTLSGKDRAL